jgi:heme-degrading monooxygenase HmoA
MILQIVRFKSALPEEQLLKVSEERAPRYRALKGLVQKYYLRYNEPGEYGAVFVWESEAALKEFQESELRQTVPAVYQVQGAPDIRTAELMMTLRPAEKRATPGS